jgi:hypothetical protein
MTTAGLVVGAYSYMSPEQVAGEAAGPAIYGVAFSPDGHSMAATSNTGDALVWDTSGSARPELSSGWPFWRGLPGAGLSGGISGRTRWRGTRGRR